MEALYQYVWQHRLLGRHPGRLVDGRDVDVLDPGRLNRDAGPDFFNGKIVIDGVEWVGNIEVHVKASDWFRHSHDADGAYDNVVLHVVGVDDVRLQRRDGSEIPQLVMSLPKSLCDLHGLLDMKTADIRCRHLICGVPELTLTDWLEALAVERLQQKSERIAARLESSGGDWETACFVTLARGLGFGLNAEPFEMLAASVPLSIVRKHSDDRVQLEALLFGQAGMLDSSACICDEYYHKLCREYSFLMRKYGLRPIFGLVWKNARTRPQNFPHRRIALLARMLEGAEPLLQRILDARSSVDDLRSLFACTLEGYWQEHHTFGSEASPSASALSASSLDLLIINVAAPVIYAYGVLRSDEDAMMGAEMLLRQLPAENNAIVRGWRAIGVNADDAMRSQALIHLKREYCEVGKCMYCRVGHKMFRSAAVNKTLI